MKRYTEIPVVISITNKGVKYRFASDSVAICDQIAAREASKSEVVEVIINKRVVYKKK